MNQIRKKCVIAGILAMILVCLSIFVYVWHTKSLFAEEITAWLPSPAETVDMSVIYGWTQRYETEELDSATCRRWGQEISAWRVREPRSYDESLAYIGGPVVLLRIRDSHDVLDIYFENDKGLIHVNGNGEFLGAYVVTNWKQVTRQNVIDSFG